ncbi:TonB-dependent receptor plug domain-containing protein [Teredinibacter haidensis]|uniref:TonB-dependent receptor plug domain-containing protein n=1 Tax=Teredinibacter haidensis TaxID=2731755 RepID=UPI000948D4A4|nr:TonB-dependent receptor [Teredinibacter haidensis]
MKAPWSETLVLTAVLIISGTALAEDGLVTAADLIEMDFEELVNMDVEVESAGKNRTRAMDLPYAAFVISNSDIRQSGAQTIPDALRLAPGVSVNQISAGEWAVGIRGGGGRFSRYVLIIVDGRIAYNAVFSGVNWDELNLSLSQIERIEIIRGPNAVAWGANAVNGIINIVTEKPSAKKTNKLAAWGGTDDRTGASLNYSQALKGQWFMGIAGQAQRWRGLKTFSDNVREDGHEDWRLSTTLNREAERETTQFSADVFGMRQTPVWNWYESEDLSMVEAANREDKHGWTLLGSHQAAISDFGFWTVRGSYERTKRDATLYQWDATNYQLDMEVTARWKQHNLSVGVNGRLNDSYIKTREDFGLRFLPRARTIRNSGVFLSDAINLSESVQLTLSARLDKNELSATSLQPSIRMLWSPTDDDRLWIAASEARTTPARALVDIADVTYAVVPAESAGSPYPIGINVNGYQEEEDDSRLKALELGYRRTFDDYNFDIAVFDFDYANDVSLTPLGEPVLILDRNHQPTHFVQQAVFDNVREYGSRGGEISMRGMWSEWWTFQVSYSRVGRSDVASGWSSNFSFMNNIQLSETIHWNIWLRYTHGNDSVGAQFADSVSRNDASENYVLIDTNIHWDISSRWTLSVIANALGDEHVEAEREEFGDTPFLVEPYVMMKMGLNF